MRKFAIERHIPSAKDLAFLVSGNGLFELPGSST